MVVGDLGHRGTPALLPVMEVSSTANVFVPTPSPNMEERIVRVMVLCLKYATARPALLVSI